MPACPNCGTEIDKHGMASHQAGDPCRTKGNLARLKSRGWLPCTKREAVAFKVAGIELDSSPTKYSPGHRGRRGRVGGPTWADSVSINIYRELRARFLPPAEAATRAQARQLHPLPDIAMCPYCEKFFQSGPSLWRHLRQSEECHGKNLGQAQQARCRMLGVRVRGYSMAARLMRVPEDVLGFFAGLTGSEAIWDWKLVEHIEALIQESAGLPPEERLAWIQTQHAGHRLTLYADLA